MENGKLQITMINKLKKWEIFDIMIVGCDSLKKFEYVSSVAQKSNFEEISNVLDTMNHEYYVKFENGEFTYR